MKDMKADGVTEWAERLRQAAMKAVTEDDMREIFQNLVRDAKAGNKRAIDLLLKFTQPAPPPGPPLLPAQQIKANTVNVYAGSRKRPPKLLGDVVNGKVIGCKNGGGVATNADRAVRAIGGVPTARAVLDVLEVG